MNIEYCLHQNNHDALFGKLKSLDPTQRFKVEVKPWKSKRSLEQNDRYWKLVTEFGEYCGYDKEEMHQEIGKRFLTYEKTINGVVKTFVKSTTKLNTKEMAELQEKIERVAAQQGFIFE